MNITWHGTASILLETAQQRLLFDPFVQGENGAHPNSLTDFLNEQTILITHGHLDHLREVPALLAADRARAVSVYCGSVAARTLHRQIGEDERVKQVTPGMQLRFPGCEVLVWQARHAVPGRELTRETLRGPRVREYRSDARQLLRQHVHMPEGGQTYLYEVRTEGKRVLIMGSLGLAEGVRYPEGADLLVLPYQGSAHLETDALAVVERLKPKRIVLDHFDDAFPPITSPVETGSFLSLMAERHPELPVLIPQVKTPVAVP